mmetsp:Transcript_35365/g.100120  ORF Transcript_35365/g.100120 Transcript_35365/m.100120 type:complete len:130 (-) Transcript_35365:5-394(-)
MIRHWAMVVFSLHCCCYGADGRSELLDWKQERGGGLDSSREPHVPGRSLAEHGEPAADDVPGARRQLASVHTHGQPIRISVQINEGSGCFSPGDTFTIGEPSPGTEYFPQYYCDDLRNSRSGMECKTTG